MRTATVRELRNQYRSVLDWVEAGEEVTISRRGRIIARIVPEKSKAKKVDWSKSGALTMDRTKFPVSTAEDTLALIHESQGRY